MREEHDTRTLERMIEEGKFDLMTDGQCEWLTIDSQYMWQKYCWYVLPDCTPHFFQHGCEEE
jgi:hypothetical protein